MPRMSRSIGCLGVANFLTCLSGTPYDEDCGVCRLVSILGGPAFLNFKFSFEADLMSSNRRLQVTEAGEVTVVHFNDRKILDESNIQEMGQELFDLIERQDRKKLLLNFTHVEFLSSAALGKLITLNKRRKAHGASLKLCGIRPDIYEVFSITKLDRLFEIHEDEADAMAAF